MDDGSVVGSYGWVDANGIMRLYDYIADQKGYRILKTRLINTAKQGPEAIESTSKPTRKFHLPLDNSIDGGSNQFSRRIGVIEPSRPVARVAPSAVSPRLQRRLNTPNGNSRIIDVQPLFDFDESVDQQPQLKSQRSSNAFVSREEKSLEDAFSPDVILNEVQLAQSRSVEPRIVSRTRSDDGRRVVIKRRRPTGIPRFGLLTRAPLQESIASTVDYETQKSFHVEEEAEDGSRVGQYGYIDPIGVRRVVNYSTGANGEIIKTKENDYVGTNTYFHAN